MAIAARLRQIQHGACKEPAQEPAQHLLSSSPDWVCTGRYLLLRAEAWRQSPAPWGPVPPAGSTGVTRAPGAQGWVPAQHRGCAGLAAERVEL